MTPVLASIVGIVLLLAVLGFSIARPKGLPEAVAAVPAAGLALLIGLISVPDALAAVETLGPTIGFLAAILVIAHLADVDGVFRWIGGLLVAGSRGSAQRLLTLVFVVASLTTALLSLDATVVLLTPVLLGAVRRLQVSGAPPVYAAAHLSNTASLLLPVSNLTNLLAFHASGLTFVGFAALMAGPWVAAIAVEYVIFRWAFRNELAPSHDAPARTATAPDAPAQPAPTASLVLLGVILVAVFASSAFGVEPVWVAGAGALVWLVWDLSRRRVGVPAVVAALNPWFLVFVAALGVVVQAAIGHGLQDALAGVLPGGDGLLALLALAVIAAVLANLINNLPATLVLLAALGAAPPAAAVLAVLIGVNIGPNLTYAGSLATMLWRRILHEKGHGPSLRRFTVLGLTTVGPTLLAAVLALWAAHAVS
ncbi:ArsB/NhaD family transporter [Nakamurella sp.]|uniref:ArsB/NhaD family transporter n=1 Tax=Nakamurella sp. TaxID=1869182 RepID=UPI003B3ADBB8